MIYVIRRPAVLQARHSWTVNAVAFALASVLAASGVGAVLGSIGGAVIGDAHRVDFTRVLAAAAIAVAILDFTGRRPRLVQRDRETSRRILERYEPHLAVARNGVELGIGATSRIGFWLWYAVPVGAFLAATAPLGTLIYGSYGTARGVAPSLIIAIEARMARRAKPEFEYVPRWLVRRTRLARIVAATQLCVVGVGLAFTTF